MELLFKAGGYSLKSELHTAVKNGDRVAESCSNSFRCNPVFLHEEAVIPGASPLNPTLPKYTAPDTYTKAMGPIIQIVPAQKRVSFRQVCGFVLSFQGVGGGVALTRVAGSFHLGTHII